MPCCWWDMGYTWDVDKACLRLWLWRHVLDEFDHDFTSCSVTGMTVRTGGIIPIPARMITAISGCRPMITFINCSNPLIIPTNPSIDSPSNLLSNMSVENPQSVHDFPIATSMYKRFFIAIFPDRRVNPFRLPHVTSLFNCLAFSTTALAGRRLRSKHIETAEDVGGSKDRKTHISWFLVWS